ncbi:MAG TPA: N-acetylmuramoyl-L-alanine amidase [Longimicrobium sp.]|nr:N-acetylmuramoyl-L-alanine amidase [Longimicrobium sp.]
MSSDIFISYAREDRGRVQPIAEALAQRGYGVWWDKGLRGGEDYRDRIEEMLKTARCVVVAWSKDSVQSDFVLDEAGRGHRRKVLLPVFLDQGIEPPLGFGGIHTSDLSGWLRDPSDPAPLEQFVADVAAVLARDGAPVPVPPPAHAPAPPPTGVRKLGLWPVAIGGGALMVAAAAMYLGARDAGVDITSEMGQDTSPSLASVDSGPGRGPLAADSGTVPARVADGGAALDDLRCALPGIGRNPIAGRVERLTRAEFRVDTTQHLLVRADSQPVRVVQANSVGSALLSRRLIVAHHTAAPGRPVEAYFERGTINSSAHLLIDRTGRVTQLVPFDITAYHAGRSQWKDVEGLNRHSLGIEMENLGRLSQRDGRWYWQSTAVPSAEVQVIDGVGWHRYTDAQLVAFFQVSCALRRAYPTIEDVVGHGDIARPAGTKVDPGPAFPLSVVRRRLFPERPPERGV